MRPALGAMANARAGGPGIARTVGQAASLPRGSAAALGLPDARAGAVAAAPGARARRPGQAAGARRVLVAGAHVDGDRAVLADLAADAHAGGAGVAQIAVGDADGIAIGRIADAFLGDDHDAPHTIVAR